MSDVDINKMDFKQLRDEVQSLRDEVALFKRKIEDTLHNLDSDNFSDSIIKENDKFRTMISVSAGKIKTLVSDTEGLNTQISQTAEEIRATAEKVAENAEKIAEIIVTAEGITSKVEASFDLANAELAMSVDDMTDTKKIYVIEETGDEGNTTEKIYYYYSSVTENWETMSGDSVYTVFEQTPDGFALKGNVKVSGDLITAGTIDAERIDTENLSCTKLYAKDNPDLYYAKLNGSFGDFGIYSPLSKDAVAVNGNTCMFGIRNSVPNINLYVYGHNFLGYDVTNHKTWVKGVWDFSGDDVEVLGLTPIAVFG